MSYVDEVLAQVIKQNPNEPEFHQAVEEVLNSLRPAIEANEEQYRRDATADPEGRRGPRCGFGGKVSVWRPGQCQAFSPIPV